MSTPMTPSSSRVVSGSDFSTSAPCDAQAPSASALRAASASRRVTCPRAAPGTTRRPPSQTPLYLVVPLGALRGALRGLLRLLVTRRGLGDHVDDDEVGESAGRRVA